MKVRSTGLVEILALKTHRAETSTYTERKKVTESWVSLALVFN